MNTRHKTHSLLDSNIFSSRSAEPTIHLNYRSALVPRGDLWQWEDQESYILNKLLCKNCLSKYLVHVKILLLFSLI